MHRLAATTMAAFAIAMALVAATASAGNDRVLTGSFPIDEQFVLEPDSTICGFPITLAVTGRATYNGRRGADGELEVLHVHSRTVGTLSGNGVVLREVSSQNLFLDFATSTMREIGLIFRDSRAGHTVVMDRGRLVWAFDPETGEPVGDAIFEAGPHPGLDGGPAPLCAALTP